MMLMKSNPKSAIVDRKKQVKPKAVRKQAREPKMNLPFEFHRPDPSLSYAEQLEEYGAVVIPCMTPEEAAASLERFKEEIRASPYIKDGKREEFLKDVSLGKVGMCSLPTVFHAKEAIALRKRIAGLVREHLAGFRGSTHFSVAPDRIGMRPDGTEHELKLHRDIFPWDAEFPEPHMQEKKEAIAGICGGWMALAGRNVATVAIGAHKDMTGGKTGFVPIPAELPGYRPRMKHVEIPPGSLFLFFQRMPHFIAKTKMVGGDMWRMFHAVFFLRKALVTDAYNLRSAESGAPPHLPSGQDPPMYDTFHAVNHQAALRAFSDMFSEKIPRDKSGFIPRFLLHPGAYGLPYQCNYRGEDIQDLKPQAF